MTTADRLTARVSADRLTRYRRRLRDSHAAHAARRRSRSRWADVAGVAAFLLVCSAILPVCLAEAAAAPTWAHALGRVALGVFASGVLGACFGTMARESVR